jgi:hypothetical protein
MLKLIFTPPNVANYNAVSIAQIAETKAFVTPLTPIYGDILISVIPIGLDPILNGPLEPENLFIRYDR